jgi:hypothetical protein
MKERNKQRNEEVKKEKDITNKTRRKEFVFQSSDTESTNQQQLPQT